MPIDTSRRSPDRQLAEFSNFVADRVGQVSSNCVIPGDVAVLPFEIQQRLRSGNRLLV